MTAARPRVRVHVVAIDDERRMLLDRRPKSPAWALPWANLGTGEDPERLTRTVVHDTGALPSMAKVHAVKSTVEQGEHFLDLTYRCSAQRNWTTTPQGSTALWWSLDEISSLDLAPCATTALVDVWPSIWPQV